MIIFEHQDCRLEISLCFGRLGLTINGADGSRHMELSENEALSLADMIYGHVRQCLAERTSPPQPPMPPPPQKPPYIGDPIPADVEEALKRWRDLQPWRKVIASDPYACRSGSVS